MEELQNVQLLAALPELLLPWFREHRRELPWRQDREPYHVWLSEIMLQQTRVEAVKEYYSRFLSALPTVQALAEADEDALLKLWEGLGYYSRARNLKKAAGSIMEVQGGVFPDSYDEIRKLPGIGDYTAGAIASICFDRKTPAVDGNVLRVVSRYLDYHGCTDDIPVRRAVSRALAEIYPEKAGDFTQSIMELGATVCIPNGTPHCDLCPLRDKCLAREQGTFDELPVRAQKKPRRQEAMTVFLLTCGRKIAIRKRPDTGLLAGLWEFPNVPGTLSPQEAADMTDGWGLSPEALLKTVSRTHIFTHIQWNMTGVRLDCGRENRDFLWAEPEEIRSTYSLPTAFRQFLEDFDGESRLVVTGGKKADSLFP